MYVRNGRSWLNKGCTDNIVCAALHSGSTFVTASRYIFVGITIFAFPFIRLRPLSPILVYRTLYRYPFPSLSLPSSLLSSPFLADVDHPPSRFLLRGKAFSEQPPSPFPFQRSRRYSRGTPAVRLTSNSTISPHVSLLHASSYLIYFNSFGRVSLPRR